MPMKVYSAYQDGRLTIYLQGELDHHEARKSMQTIESLLDEYLPKESVLDLGELTFMDSSGIALLLKLHRRMASSGGEAWAVNAAGQPGRVLEASGIQKILRLNLTRED